MPTDDWVSASEIAAFEYCARSYWLDRVRHVRREVESDARLERGLAHHVEHGRRVSAQRWMVRVAMGLLAVATVLLAVAAYVGRAR